MAEAWRPGGVQASWPAVILEFTQFFVLFFYNWIKHAIFACLPMGVRPRKDVTGKVVLVTGAGSGIGRLLSIEFAKLGCKLILVDINQDGLDVTKRQVRDAGAQSVHTYKVNLAEKKDIERFYQEANWAEHGDVDILINNAGIVSGGTLMDVPDKKISLTMDVNVMSHFWLTKQALPNMIKKKSGHLVSIASGAGLFGCSELADYCASKFAAVGLLESLMLESHAHQMGIATTVICPYYINTGMFDGVTNRFDMILPILDPDYAVARMMEAILCEEEMTLMPKLIYVLFAVKALLPVKCSLMLADITGVSHSMDKFVGRSGKAKSS